MPKNGATRKDPKYEKGISEPPYAASKLTPSGSMPKRIFHKNGIGFRSTDWLRLIVPVVVLALFGLAAWKLGLFDANGAKQVESATGTAGTVWFQPVFVLVFAALAALAMPLAPLAYGAGAIFGIVRGSILSWIASMIGATAGYYLARGVLAGTARRLLGKRRDILHDLGETTGR